MNIFELLNFEFDSLDFYYFCPHTLPVTKKKIKFIFHFSCGFKTRENELVILYKACIDICKADSAVNFSTE